MGKITKFFALVILVAFVFSGCSPVKSTGSTDSESYSSPTPPEDTPSPNSSTSIDEFSPLTGKIAFYSNRDQNFDIYVFDLVEKSTTRLTPQNSREFFPSWSPDGTRILFMSDRDGSGQIYVMNNDGTNQTRLTYLGENVENSDPIWWLDGNGIFFTSDRDGNRDIFSMSLDGTIIQNLTNHPMDDFCVDISPAGDQYLFTSDRGEGYALYTDSLYDNNDSPIRLSSYQPKFICGHYSPDGEKIAYWQYEDNAEIFVMNSDGSNTYQLTFSQITVNTNPIWVGNGRIIFQRFDNDSKKSTELFIIDLDGENETQLTFDGVGNFNPSWIP